MKQKSLLLLIPHLDLGGGARRIQAYCRHLPLLGWSVSVLVCSESVQRDVTAIIGNKTSFFCSESISEIESFVLKQKPDCIYGFFDGRFQPRLFQILSYAKETLGTKIILNNVFSYYDSRMEDLTDRIIFQSRHMGFIKYAQALPQDHELPLQKISILHNPISPEYLNNFLLSEQEAQMLRHQFGWNKKTCVAGRFGREDIVKWGDQLTAAIWKLRNDRNVAFLLVGVPRSRKLIFRLFTLLAPQLTGRIVIITPTKDDRRLMTLMQACDVMVHSVNIGEGWSNAINEALFWGKPVITTSTPHCDNGQIEQVFHRYNGYIAQNTDEWVAAVRRLARDTMVRQKLGRNAKTLVEKQLTAPFVVRRFAAILNDTIQETTEMTTSRYEYTKYFQWYEKRVRQHPVYKPQNLWYKVLNTLRRISNYIEHQWI